MDLSVGNLRLSDVKDAQLRYNLIALLTAGGKSSSDVFRPQAGMYFTIHHDAFHEFHPLTSKKPTRLYGVGP